MSNKKELQTLLVKGSITATSSKEGKFKNSDPRKAAYLKLTPESVKKAEAFGLTKYTSKEDNTDFFIVKLANEITAYNLNEEYDKVIKMDTSLDAPNFETDEIGIAILKGQSELGTYYRIFALNVINYGQEIRFTQLRNPFEDLEGNDLPF